MVPFTFEKIARSASFDTSNAFPVSEAARAAHESFESHLQRAAATTVDEPTRGPAQKGQPRDESESAANEPPRNESPQNESPQNESPQNESPQSESPQNESPQNESPQNESPQNEPAQNEPTQNEPARRDADETPRDAADGDVRINEDAEAATASETAAEGNGLEVEADTASPYAVVIVTTAADELSAPIQEVEPDAAHDSDDGPDRVAASKPTVAPASDKGAELDASLATKSEETPDKEVVKSGDGAAALKVVNQVSRDGVEPVSSEPPTRRVNSSESNEEVAAKEAPAAAPIADPTIPDNEPPQTGSAPQRQGHRGDVSPIQQTHETPEAASKPVAVNVVETAADSASDDSSPQRRHHREADATQPAGNTAPADVTTTTTGTPSRFAQHLLARTEDPNGRGTSITNADQARFVDRVARAVQATGERGGTLRLRLSPPELGSLTLEVKVQGGVVSARVETDTSAARSLLLENLPLLRERLAEHGMRVDQFDVDLTDRQAGGTPDGLPQNDQRHEHRPRAKATSPEADDTPLTISSETPTKNGNEHLNIIV